jgi:hypothetical protein
VRPKAPTIVVLVNDMARSLAPATAQYGVAPWLAAVALTIVGIAGTAFVTWLVVAIGTTCIFDFPQSQACLSTELMRQTAAVLAVSVGPVVALVLVLVRSPFASKALLGALVWSVLAVVVMDAIFLAESPPWRSLGDGLTTLLPANVVMLAPALLYLLGARLLRTPSV